jgi:hypothetical protein
MKKIILSLITVGVVALPIVAMAQLPPKIGSLPDMVGKIEAAVWTIFGLIAVICFVVAGILFLTAGGVPEKVQAARSAFLWGVAGVIVGILAYSIIAIVSSVV